MRRKKNQWIMRCEMTTSFSKKNRARFNEHSIADAFYEMLIEELRVMKVSNTAHWTVLWVKPLAARRRR